MKDDKYLTGGYWFGIPEEQLSTKRVVVFERGTMMNDNPTIALVDSASSQKFVKEHWDNLKTYQDTCRGTKIPIRELRKQRDLDSVVNASNDEKIKAATELMFRKVPLPTLSTSKEHDYKLIDYGETCSPMVAWKNGIGVCYQKASILTAILRNLSVQARVVGFEVFPDEEWEKIYSRHDNVLGYMIDHLKDDSFASNALIIGDHYRKAIIDIYSNFDVGNSKISLNLLDKVKEEGVLKLRKKNHLGMHYWVEAYGSEGWTDIDTTVPQIQRDVIYAEIFEAMKQIKYVCAEVKEKDIKPGTTIIVQKDKRVKNTGKKRVGRNKPCPCGSGLKFKKCCL